MTNSLPYPTLDSVDLSGKKVLLRAGFDLPMADGHVEDTSRVEALVPTMKHILDAGAALIIMAHQGRPKGDREPEFSQKPIVPVLQKFLGVDVQFAETCVGDDAKQMAAALQPGSVLLLENLRYEAAEKSKDAAERDAFGKELASLADVYVNDAFTNCHRDHASMTSVPKYLPSCIGLSLAQEIQHLTAATQNPKKPLTLIISGAKMETKVPVIEHFLDAGDHVLVGGLIANTFIAGAGYDMGASRYEEEWAAKAKEIHTMSRNTTNASIHIPTDAVVATGPDAEPRNIPLAEIAADDCIFDVGNVSAQHFAHIIKESGTVIWNGPLGMYENEKFAAATTLIADALRNATANGTMSIIGGGDTIDFHNRYGVTLDEYTWVSMGGGAMVEFISGSTLPALEILKK